MSVNIAIVTGTTRPDRKAGTVSDWVRDIAAERTDAEVEVVDIADYDLPLLDEAVPPSQGRYQQDHTKRWAATVDRFDAYVFVTPEYNHGIPGALKNALDFLYAEWNNKAAGFVAYGSDGGTRSVEQLRLVMGELQVADVRGQVSLSLFTDFEDMTRFSPQPHQEPAVGTMLDQLVTWGGALRQVRTP